ncbi:hypothetical protein Tco_0773280 [Tanacetum coccineum]|uniref:Uncharacterized protein n=1 Tax=Tanacetum coccineum TaxID=301880 RepID=A0ABQ4ZKE5_9ASTR
MPSATYRSKREDVHAGVVKAQPKEGWENGTLNSRNSNIAKAFTFFGSHSKKMSGMHVSLTGRTTHLDPLRTIFKDYGGGQIIKNTIGRMYRYLESAKSKTEEGMVRSRLLHASKRKRWDIYRQSIWRFGAGFGQHVTTAWKGQSLTLRCKRAATCAFQMKRGEGK